MLNLEKILISKAFLFQGITPIDMVESISFIMVCVALIFIQERSVQTFIFLVKQHGGEKCSRCNQVCKKADRTRIDILGGSRLNFNMGFGSRLIPCLFSWDGR